MSVDIALLFLFIFNYCVLLVVLSLSLLLVIVCMIKFLLTRHSFRTILLEPSNNYVELHNNEK